MGDLFDFMVNDIWVTNFDALDRFAGGASTSYELLGLVYMSLREPSEHMEFEQIFALAHELGHTVLYLTQAGLLPIEKSSWSKWVYSGLRKTERPSYASLHAAVALGYMLSICNSLMTSNLYPQNSMEFLAAKQDEFKISLNKGLSALLQLELTPVGKVIFRELSDLLNSN